MGIFHFPSNFVYWRKVPNHKILKEKILRYIDENPNEHVEHYLTRNGYVSIKDKTEKFLINCKELINSVVWDTVDEALKELNSLKNTLPLDLVDSIINDCWYTIYKTNSNISIHNHEGMGRECKFINGVKYRSTFSLIYIVNDENKKNETIFVQFGSETPSIRCNRQVEFKTSELEDVGEGTVFIFPSNLYHEVRSIPKGDRVILACDVLSSFESDGSY
jgi:hypothetical protein